MSFVLPAGVGAPRKLYGPAHLRPPVLPGGPFKLVIYPPVRPDLDLRQGLNFHSLRALLRAVKPIPPLCRASHEWIRALLDARSRSSAFCLISSVNTRNTRQSRREC